MTLWVFGYGSLLWDPGFDIAERRLATLHGYARSFCMHSIHHRGTPQLPGLVLALDASAGAACEGIAMRVPAGQEERTLAYLRGRELISSAYLEKRLPIAFEDNAQVSAVTYVIDPGHVQYCGALPLEQQARIIARAQGDRGPNTEYLFNTADHLREIGLHDPDLDWLAARVRALAASTLGEDRL